MDIDLFAKAIMAELEDRSLLNGIDDEIRKEIETAIGDIIDQMGSEKDAVFGGSSRGPRSRRRAASPAYSHRRYPRFRGRR